MTRVSVGWHSCVQRNSWDTSHMELTSTINPRRMQGILPGAVTALVIAFAATFVAEHYGGPQFLYALLFGMAFNFLASDAKTQAGIEFASRWVLRFGVALLGSRITAEQITALGIGPV